MLSITVLHKVSSTAETSESDKNVFGVCHEVLGAALIAIVTLGGNKSRVNRAVGKQGIDETTNVVRRISVVSAEAILADVLRACESVLLSVERKGGFAALVGRNTFAQRAEESQRNKGLFADILGKIVDAAVAILLTITVVLEELGNVLSFETAIKVRIPVGWEFLCFGTVIAIRRGLLSLDNTGDEGARDNGTDVDSGGKLHGDTVCVLCFDSKTVLCEGLATQSMSLLLSIAGFSYSMSEQFSRGSASRHGLKIILLLRICLKAARLQRNHVKAPIFPHLAPCFLLVLRATALGYTM